MMLKNRKFQVVTSGGKIPIDEDELVKVYEAVSGGSIKILRQGWFNPSFFVAVIEDDEYMKEYRDSQKHRITSGEITQYPQYQDLFPTLREEIKKVGLISGNNLNEQDAFNRLESGGREFTDRPQGKKI